jgi:mRNA degradation ribonuclease J1/J2
VSVWLIPTAAGLILIDAGQEPFVDYILNNIRNVGYDPRDIKYIPITHPRLDHSGGAAPIQELSGARVGAVEGDWVLMDEYATKPLPATPPLHRTVERDMVLKEGDTNRIRQSAPPRGSAFWRRRRRDRTASRPDAAIPKDRYGGGVRAAIAYARLRHGIHGATGLQDCRGCRLSPACSR